MRKIHTAVAVRDLAEFGDELSHTELVKISGGRKTTTTTTTTTTTKPDGTTTTTTTTTTTSGR